MLIDMYNKIIICVKITQAAIFRIVRNYGRKVALIESFGRFSKLPE
jgi:hypothetical protein